MYTALDERLHSFCDDLEQELNLLTRDDIVASNTLEMMKQDKAFLGDHLGELLAAGYEETYILDLFRLGLVKAVFEKELT